MAVEYVLCTHCDNTHPVTHCDSCGKELPRDADMVYVDRVQLSAAAQKRVEEAKGEPLQWAGAITRSLCWDCAEKGPNLIALAITPVRQYPDRTL